MKRFLAILVAGLLSIMTVACGASDSNSVTESASNSAETAQKETASGEAEESDVFADLPDELGIGNEVAAVPEMYSNVDLSEPVNINIYMVGDTPADWEMIAEAANEYLEPFNTTISATFLSYADYTTLYPLALQGEDCDIIYTA